MASTYNFLKSLERLDLRLNAQMDIKYLPVIPSYNECGTQGSLFVYGTVVAVRFCLSEENLNISETKAVKTLECFVSEVCEIFRSNQSCRDVIVSDSMITTVYNTSMKTEINGLLDDMAMVRSIAAVISKKAELGNKQITVKLAACYDKLSMSVVEARNAYKQYLWRGDAINKAYKLSDKARDGSILLNKVVWNNLTDANQKLFELNSIFEEVYEGRIVNIAMNNWLDSK